MPREAKGAIDSPQATQAVAYLASEYPAISHTFIFREIEALRARHVPVRTVSVRFPEHIERMGRREQDEARRTYYIKQTPRARVALRHALLMLATPLRYLRMVGYTVRLRRSSGLRLGKLLAYFLEAGLLLDWMRHGGADHVHVHFGNPAATVALIAASTGAVSFSLSVHGPDVFDNVAPNLLREKIARAAFVRCISHYCRSQLMRLAPADMWSKFHIVRCGVDTQAFTPRPDPRNNTPEIVCLGRLVPAKGQHVLLDACRILNERGIECHVTFVGDGPDRPALERAAAALRLNGAVTFTGAVGQDKVHECLNRADVMVLPSFAEGLPVVLMEAMAKEVPCVSSRTMGIPELIQDGLNGLLAAPSDVEELADKMQRLIQNPALRMKLGRRGREAVAASYDITVNAGRMYDLFAEYLSPAGKTDS